MGRYLAIHFLILAFYFGLFSFLAKLDFGFESGRVHAPHISLKTLIDPELSGPERLCIVFGSVIGDFFGAGDPATDVYSWRITDATGNILFEGSGGAGFQTLSFTFSDPGDYVVSLQVSRGSNIIYQGSQTVEVIDGAQILLEPRYTTCSDISLTLLAIDPSSVAFDDYIFEWTDESGSIISTTNELADPFPGQYEVSFYQEDSQGNITCEQTLGTQVELADEVKILASSGSTCPGEPVEFQSDPSIVGNWYFIKEGNTEEKFLRTGTGILIEPSFFLDGPGEYEIVFRVEDLRFQSCQLEDRVDLTYYPRPEFVVIESSPSSGCNVPDGTVTIEAITPFDDVVVQDLFQNSGPLAPGDTFQFTGLESGTFTGLGTLGECIFRQALVVGLDNPPDNLDFSILDLVGEMCTETGKIDGSFIIELSESRSEGGYRVINERGSIVRSQLFDGGDQYPIEIAGGTYYVEVFDLDECKLPAGQEVEVGGLQQVQFFVQNDISVCQSFEYRPITAQNIEFMLTRPDGSEVIKNSGEFFTLDQEGEYQILGIYLDDDQTICPRQQTFNVTLVDPIEFEPVLVEQDCFGNRIYQALLTDVDPADAVFTWFNELEEIVSKAEFMIPVSNGMYKLDVQPRGSQACPIPPKEFLIEEPILSVDLTLESSQLCEFGQPAIISLTSTFPDEITDIEWRRYDVVTQQNITPLPEFDNQPEIEVTEEGIYEASVYSRIPEIGKDCELGRNTIEVLIDPQKVEFEIPLELEICESIDFTPQTDEDLIIQLTRPDGSIEEKASGESFLLDQAGTYSFLGIDNSMMGKCPDLKEMILLVNDIPAFEPELKIQECDGNQTYRARVENYSQDEVSFIWRDGDENIVGTDSLFRTSEIGMFSLEVQPLQGENCPSSPMEFEIEELVLEVEVKLEADPLCPDAETTLIRALADFENVDLIQWQFTDINGNTTDLPQFENQEEIEVNQEGTYEVSLFNDLGCLLGNDLVLVLRVMDSERPELEDSYQICPRYEIGPVLDPGSFAAYEWYFENTLVSTNPTYKPTNVGEYTVLVTSQEGCSYAESFETIEECELRVSFPNAIEPADPDKLFLVYTNYLIDEMDVSIFNQWGQLVFYCKESNLLSEEAACFWDGTFEGKKVPNGSYAVRINYKNFERNITEFQLGTILVIE